MTKQATVELLQKQLPGFYSVEQVIEMINGIEDVGDGPSMTSEKVMELIELLTNKVERKLNGLDAGDLVDYDSAQFELNGNEISVYEIDVNVDTIRDEVSDVIDQVLTDFFPAPQEA